MTEQDKPSRGEQLQQHQKEQKAKRNRWMLSMLAGGLTIIFGIGLLLHNLLFSEFNRIFFAICSILGEGMMIAGGVLMPDKSTHKDKRNPITEKVNARRTGRYKFPESIPLPALLAILGVLFVVSGIVTLIRG